MKIYETLVKYRVAYIAVILFFMIMTWDTIQWYKQNHLTLSEAAVAGFISIVLSLVGALKYALENLGKDKHDDGHK